MVEDFNQPQIENLSLLFKNCFSIPVFQRPYSWGRDEIGELFEDIDEYFSAKNDSVLFMGTIYMATDTQVKSSIWKYSIVDGQQRLTTLALTCLVLYHYALKYGLDKIEGDDTVVILRNFLWKKTNGRELNKNEPLLNSSSIEQKAMKFVFDTLFDYAGKDDLFDILNDYRAENRQEEKIIENVRIIDSKINEYVLKSAEENKEIILDYIDFITNNLKFITITVNKGNERKLFEIFESINSKGKQLEQIDLIKSYIFQNIDDEDYETYLNIWGDLIKETDDRLENYMYIFIKSFIRFYKVGLSAKNFKTLGPDLMRHYNRDTLSDSLKALLTDMHAKVRYYRNMIDADSYLINNNKFKFYTECLRLLEYEHPSPVIFRSYCEYGSGELGKEGLTEVARACLSYMLAFQTIADRDSKDAISTFEKIMEDIMKNGYNSKKIVATFREELVLNGIDTVSIRDNIFKFVGYTEKKEKMASRILLAAYEFSEDGEIKYDKALYAMKSKDVIQVDHILPQTPEKDNENCSYYPEETEQKSYVLRLKPNNDFDGIPDIADGVDYVLFRTRVLDKIGNLQLMWRDENIGKSNEIVQLKDYSTFNTYEKITKRAEKLARDLAKNEIFTI